MPKEFGVADKGACVQGILLVAGTGEANYADAD
jgi:hypothetical protein